MIGTRDPIDISQFTEFECDPEDYETMREIDRKLMIEHERQERERLDPTPKEWRDYIKEKGMYWQEVDIDYDELYNNSYFMDDYNAWSYDNQQVSYFWYHHYCYRVWQTHGEWAINKIEVLSYKGEPIHIYPNSWYVLTW